MSSATIPLGGELQNSLRWIPAADRVYFNIEDKSEVVVIDTHQT